MVMESSPYIFNYAEQENFSIKRKPLHELLCKTSQLPNQSLLVYGSKRGNQCGPPQLTKANCVVTQSKNNFLLGLCLFKNGIKHNILYGFLSDQDNLCYNAEPST